MKFLSSILIAGLLSVSVRASASTMTCWDGSLLAEGVKTCPLEPATLVCADGALTTDTAFCSQIIADYFGPMERDINISGLSDRFLSGMIATDDLSVRLAYSLEDPNDGSQAHFYLDHGTNEKDFLLKFNQVFLSGKQVSKEYAAIIGADGSYEFRTKDGHRLDVVECIMNAIARKNRETPQSDIEFESSCQKS